MSDKKTSRKRWLKDTLFVNVPRLIALYYSESPDVENRSEMVTFGTSGHRGSSALRSFNQTHILAIVQAIVDYRKANKIDGPLFIGMDTHALSEAAFISAIEVLIANEVTVKYQQGGGYTPTPVLSHALLNYNRGRKSGFADAIVITPSHNPPTDGGIKYDSINGGHVDEIASAEIEANANRYIKESLKGVKRIPFEKALRSDYIKEHDYISEYVDTLDLVIDIDLLKGSRLEIAVDPLGGSGIKFYERIAELFLPNLTILNKEIDHQFKFVPPDLDGNIRMDCSSAYSMGNLIKMSDKFDISFGNDPDFDRHGIITRSSGLLNPNHYISASIWYLFRTRKGWGKDMEVGKTIVSSSMIDLVVNSVGRNLYETPVGFKWFSDKMAKGEIGFAGEESSGASFLRKDGTVWSSDKDGIIMNLLSIEMTEREGKNPALIYSDLEKKFGKFYYRREDNDILPERKSILKKVKAEDLKDKELAGSEIISKVTHAPGNKAAIGGIKISTKDGWFAVRPSGTENKYKIYMESRVSERHLDDIYEDSKRIVDNIFKS